MVNIYILKYNNYFNRLVKREEELSDYEPFIHYILQGTNFTPNDNVDTTHLIGTGDYDGAGDYALIVDQQGTILSRWYILEASRTRGGQYKMTLHRDVIADYMNVILEAPAFIEKATASFDDPAIYNSENMQFNQIKTRQQLLKDELGLGWLCVYIEKNKQLSGTILHDEERLDTYVVNGIENYEYYNKNIDVIDNTSFLTLKLQSAAGGSGGYNYWNKYFRYNLYDGKFQGYSDTTYEPISVSTQQLTFDEALNSVREIYKNVNYANLIIAGNNNYESNVPKLSYNKIFDSSTGKLYNINLVSTSTRTEKSVVRSSNEYASIYVDAYNRLERSISLKEISQTRKDNTFSVQLNIQTYQVQLFEVDNQNATLNYEFSQNHLETIDAVYDILAIPYGDYSLINGLESLYFTIPRYKETALKWATSIAEKGDVSVYDVQLLPFSPVNGQINFKHSNWGTERIPFIDVSNILTSKQFEMLYTGTKPNNSETLNNDISRIKAIGIWVKSSLFNVILDSPKLLVPQEEWKVENECSFWRLNSPNWASSWEFNVVKNGGGVNNWRVDCCYKPFTPYINIAPNFSGLYGQSFEKEARGLILSGDFSISRVSDAWTSYQLQNKTYEMSFNRQVESIERQNKYAFITDIAGAVAGTIQTAGTGAMGGAMVGGGIGATIGGIAGGVSSAIAGVVDVSMGKALREDQLDLTKDLYGYNLQSIKARPDALTKVSTFNSDNTIFPNLEYYTCTDVEKEALRYKIKYNGMTIMRIGKLSEFRKQEPTYMKARIIRLEGTGEDFHLINEISNEIYKGVFI